jgi:Domain of unknown function (DUF4157)
MSKLIVSSARLQSKPVSTLSPRLSGPLQRVAVNSSPIHIHDVPSIVQETLRSTGQPLDPKVRAFMEPRFGHDFSRISTIAPRSGSTPSHLSIGALHDDFEQQAELAAQQIMSQSSTSNKPGYDFSRVRIHTDDKAATSAQAVDALAYTVGQDIVFGHGQYNPGSFQGAKLLAHELTHVIQHSGGIRDGAHSATNDRYSAAQPINGVIAREPVPVKDKAAVDKSTSIKLVDKDGKIIDDVLNEKGELQSGKSLSDEVLRIRLDDVKGFGEDPDAQEKKITGESAKNSAYILVPGKVKMQLDKDSLANKEVFVDVLLHFHGHGIGYRELNADEEPSPGKLKRGQLRDVNLYQMEQQILTISKSRPIIAVLPQGSMKSDFGKQPTGHNEAYLEDVFKKLVGKKVLPQNATLRHLIVSAHSGGGPSAMTVAENKIPTELILFDAINFSNKTCTSNEIIRVGKWVFDKMVTDVKEILKLETDDEKVANRLKTNGTRFRGITSGDLKSKDGCSYGFYYGMLQNFIKDLINGSKAKIESGSNRVEGKMPFPLGPKVKDQLRLNYVVISVGGVHEYVPAPHNLEYAFADDPEAAKEAGGRAGAEPKK